MKNPQATAQSIGQTTQPNRPYPEPLPPQTMVQSKADWRVGIVRNYHPLALPAKMGTFPVEWQDGQWEICTTHDVITVITVPALGS